MANTAHQTPVPDIAFFPGHGDLLFLCQLLNDHCHLIQYFLQFKRLMLQLDLSGFQLAHIQHFIDKLQQQMGGVFDLCPAFCLLIQIVCIVLCHLQHAADAIDGGADIMAHSLQESGLFRIGLIRSLCFLKELLLISCLLFQSLFQILSFVSPDDQTDQENNESVDQKDQEHIPGKTGKDHTVCCISIDVIISLLAHHAVTMHFRNENDMGAVCRLFQRLYHFIIRCALSDLCGIIAGDHLSVIYDHNSPFGRDLIAFQQALYGQRKCFGAFRRYIIIGNKHPLCVFSGCSCHIDIAAVRQIESLGILSRCISFCIQRRTFP